MYLKLATLANYTTISIPIFYKTILIHKNLRLGGLLPAVWTTFVQSLGRNQWISTLEHNILYA